MRLAPKFTHDCINCDFLGRLDGQDAYKCVSTLILRHGDDGPDYRSFDQQAVDLLPDGHDFRIVARMLGD